MAKLHFVKKARKSFRNEGIKRGQPYWWWIGPKPRVRGARGVKIRSAVKPPRSALVTSEFLKSMMDIEDSLVVYDSSPEEMTAELERVKEEVDGAKEDCQSKLENIQEAFPSGCPTADLLQSRIDSCEELANEIERVSQEITDESTEEEIRGAVESIEWNYE